MKDATGKEFVHGTKYGYYTNKNGFTRVMIGIGIFSKTDGKVKLINVEQKEYLYNDGIKEPVIKILEKPVTVFCNILFPVK
jgi:hypothetical protein